MKDRDKIFTKRVEEIYMKGIEKGGRRMNERKRGSERSRQSSGRDQRRGWFTPTDTSASLVHLKRN